jgi:hypothetical protein
MTAFATRTAVAPRTTPRFADAFAAARRTFADEFLAGRSARAQRRIASDAYIQLLDRS